MSGQISTRAVKTSTILRSAAFVRGFKEARKGLPMDYDAFTGAGETRDRWNYERGRQFGCVYASTLKEGARVRYEAIMGWNAARINNWVR